VRPNPASNTLQSRGCGDATATVNHDSVQYGFIATLCFGRKQAAAGAPECRAYTTQPTEWLGIGATRGGPGLGPRSAETTTFASRAGLVSTMPWRGLCFVAQWMATKDKINDPGRTSSLDTRGRHVVAGCAGAGAGEVGYRSGSAELWRISLAAASNALGELAKTAILTLASACAGSDQTERAEQHPHQAVRPPARPAPPYTPVTVTVTGEHAATYIGEGRWLGVHLIG
jgi:hypothetical protein